MRVSLPALTPPQAAMPQDPAALQREAAEKGYGMLYSHFRSAEAGLRACAAGETVC